MRFLRNDARRMTPLLILLLVLGAACGGGSGSSSTSKGASSSPAPLKHVTFMAGFKPQANLPFVGVYVAQEKGFFRQEGVDVEIKHDISGQNLQLLEAGAVQITTADASDILKRVADPGLDLDAVALIGQKGQQGFAVLANSEIRTPSDWAGKTLGYKGSVPAEFLAIAKSANLDPGRVTQVRVGFDPRILAQKQVDILAVFMSNEPDTLSHEGFPTRVFDPNDFGVPLLGLTYVTTHAYASKDPDAVTRFLKAALHGIAYASDHRDEALDIVMKNAPQEEREHQGFMLNTELNRAVSDQTKTNGIGWQTQQQWQALASSLSEFGALSKPVDVSRVFTDEFLKHVYKNGQPVWP